MSRLRNLRNLKIISYWLLIIIIGSTSVSSAEELPESDHPYANNFEKTWIINRPSADQMRLHFEYIRLAPDDYMISDFDKITLSDKYNNVLAVYGDLITSTEGIDSKDFWTDWYSEDTIKVTLVTNGKNFDDGFKIDDVQTRLDETDESSENTDNSKYTVPESQPNVLTATKLTSSTNSSMFGQAVTFTAKVDAPSQAVEKPSGTITFMDGTTSIGIGDVTSEQVTLTTSSLSVGSHSITAKYSGDSNFKSSTSPAFTLTVPNQSSPEPQTRGESQTNPEKQITPEMPSTKNLLVNIFYNPYTITIICGIAVVEYERKKKRKENEQRKKKREEEEQK